MVLFFQCALTTTLVLCREAFTILISSKKNVLGDLNQNVLSSNTKTARLILSVVGSNPKKQPIGYKSLSFVSPAFFLATMAKAPDSLFALR